VLQWCGFCGFDHAGRASKGILKKFMRLCLALIYCFLLLSGTAQAQSPKSSPFDGMSAIEIEVAAALATADWQTSGAPEPVAASTTGPDFFRCDLVETKGRAGHEGDFPIPGNPLPGQVDVLVVFTDYAHAVQFRLETPSGDLLQYIELDAPAGQSISNSFGGTIEVPTEPFRIAASGEDLDSEAFDRACGQIYTPQSVEVRFQKEIIVAGPGLLEMVVTVTNHGPAQTFQFDANETLGLDVEVSPISVDLEEGASAPLTVSVTIPAISSGMLEIDLIATATSLADPAVQNSAQTVIRVEHFEHVFQDSYE